MTDRRIRSVADVAAWRMCLGCGACVSGCPEGRVRLVNVIDDGIRPVVADRNCGSCRACLAVCPGLAIDHRPHAEEPGIQRELLAACGRVLEIWEGHAADPELRFHASSGGMVSALALYCLEREGMAGALHVQMHPERPLENQTVFSRSRAELLARAGSRYAPASPCDGLAQIAASDRPCVFIGKPCDVTALRKSSLPSEALRARIGLAIGFFCAGTPSTRGTIEFLKRKSVSPNGLRSLRYRGRGWPGLWMAEAGPVDSPQRAEATYDESWGFLQAYRPYRCHVCPDGTGEDADISCGDAWYREPQGHDPGQSIVVVRTPRGLDILARARAAGYVNIQPATPDKLLLSQKNLIGKRKTVGGRLAAFRLMGLPTPELRGFALLSNWLSLSLGEKARSTFGTIRRIVRRRYLRPSDIS